jgi:voltage-gated potassium channel
MSGQTRIERWLDRQLARTQNPRQAAVVIAVVTTSITVLAGLLMTVVDHGGFPSLGSGLWWAVQTVTTVGYGDHVPTTVGGQLLAAVVMLLGIGFITVITAAITSSFISRARLERRLGDDAVSHAEQLKKIDERLERIEAAVGKR